MAAVTPSQGRLEALSGKAGTARPVLCTMYRLGVVLSRSRQVSKIHTLTSTSTGSLTHGV